MFPPSIRPSIPATAENGSARSTCFANVDKTMTATIASWVPLFKDVTVTAISPQVTSFEFDQAQGYPSLAHVAMSSK